MKTDRRIVITGIGLLSPVGIGRNEFSEALLHGRSGFREISLFDASRFAVRVAGEIADFDPVVYLGKKGLRTLDRSTMLISAASGMALDDAKLGITEANTNSIGVAIGATFGSIHSISQFDRVGLVEGPRAVNPSLFPNTVINSPASQVAIRFKIKGFNSTLSTGFCAGLDAVSYAADFIRLNRVDAVLAGGVEELCEELFLGFHSLGCLSGMDGTEPVSRPFDARRNGLIISEGAAVLVVEEEKHALNRGAGIVAEVLGYGSAFDPDAARDFSHRGRGLKEAVKAALEDASLESGDIDYISACANSTKGLDRMESGVIEDLFGEKAGSIPVSSVKSMIGETYSASGALSLSAAAIAINGGFIPPTMNYEERGPGCGLDYVAGSARMQSIHNALVLSADPYGNNSAVVVGRYE